MSLYLQTKLMLTIRDYYDIMDAYLSSYARQDYLALLSRTDTHIPSPDIDLRETNLPLRNRPRIQDKRKFNHHAKKSQAGLEMRLEHKKTREEKADRERKVQESFSRKMKSNRWMKRHPNSRYTIQLESHPFVY